MGDWRGGGDYWLSHKAFRLESITMIGIFDSGVGGLTVVKEIFKQLPGYQIIYFGDTARIPYGSRSEQFIRRYSKKITQWLLKKEAKIIVIACNTSSAWAAESLKKEFKGVPIFEVITPAAKDALIKTRNKKVGVIGTRGTIKSSAYSKRLLSFDPKVKVFLRACPLFVPLVEEGWIKEKTTEEIAKKYLAVLKKSGVDTLILGCTHYPLLKEIIKKTVGPGVKIVSSAENVAKEVKEFLRNNPEIEKQIKKGKNHQFFFSDKPYNLDKISHLCFDRKIKAKILDPFSK